MRDLCVGPSLAQIVPPPGCVVDVWREGLVEIVWRAHIVNHEILSIDGIRVTAAGPRQGLGAWTTYVSFRNIMRQQVLLKCNSVDPHSLTDQFAQGPRQLLRRLIEMPSNLYSAQQTRGLLDSSSLETQRGFFKWASGILAFYWSTPTDRRQQ